jgi:hypothetical protein
MSVFFNKLGSDVKLDIQKSAEVIVLRKRAERHQNPKLRRLTNQEGLNIKYVL